MAAHILEIFIYRHYSLLKELLLQEKLRIIRLEIRFVLGKMSMVMAMLILFLELATRSTLILFTVVLL